MVRFDWVHFQVSDKSNVEQLSTNSIYAVCEDRVGNIWFGTNGGGLVLFNPKNGTFTGFTKKHGLDSDEIMIIYEGDSEKCLQAGMNDYISKPIRQDIVFKVIEKWVKRNRECH